MICNKCYMPNDFNLSIGNIMILSAIGVFEKLMSACYFQIAREITVLLVNNIKRNV